MPCSGLDFQLTDEQIALKEEACKFAAGVIRPAAEQLDGLASPESVVAEDSVLWDVLRQSRELGYHTAGLPREIGGLALSPFEQSLLDEALGWGSVGLSSCIGMSNMPFAFAALFGAQKLVEEYVIPFRDDKRAKYVGCWGITEPEHGGGDQFYIGSKQDGLPLIRHNTRAKREGDEWVIRGQKSAWVVNGPIATHALVHASLDGTNDNRDAALFFIPLDREGISRGRPVEKIGQRDLNQAEIYFDEVKIPKNHMLVGPEMHGAVMAVVTAHMCGREAAVLSGMGRAALETALEYCNTRVAGGKLLCRHQLVQKRLFDMFARIESATVLARTVNLYLSQVPQPEQHYAIAALTQNMESVFEVVGNAIQLMGANGLTKEYRIEKIFRDARVALMAHGDVDTLSLGGARSLLNRLVQFAQPLKEAPSHPSG